MTPRKKEAPRKKVHFDKATKRKAFIDKMRELTSWAPGARDIEELLGSEPQAPESQASEPRVRKPRLNKRFKKPKPAENEAPKAPKAPKAPERIPTGLEMSLDYPPHKGWSDDDLDEFCNDFCIPVPPRSPKNSPKRSPSLPAAATGSHPGPAYAPTAPPYNPALAGYGPHAATGPGYYAPAEHAYPTHPAGAPAVPPSPMDAEMLDA